MKRLILNLVLYAVVAIGGLHLMQAPASAVMPMACCPGVGSEEPCCGLCCGQNPDGTCWAKDVGCT